MRDLTVEEINEVSGGGEATASVLSDMMGVAVGLGAHQFTAGVLMGMARGAVAFSWGGPLAMAIGAAAGAMASYWTFQWLS